MCTWSTRESTPTEAEAEPRRAQFSATSRRKPAMTNRYSQFWTCLEVQERIVMGLAIFTRIFCCSYARGLFNLLCAGPIRCHDSNRFVVGRHKETSHVTLKCMSQKGTIEKDICETQLKVTGSGRHTCPVCRVE